MSAFFVGIDHVNAMLTYVEHLDCTVPMPDGTRTRGKPTDAELTTIGRALIMENCFSLRARYPGDWKELLPDNWQGTDAYSYRPDYNFITQFNRNMAAAVIKMCDCYEYQSCEHEAWGDSWAHEFTQWLINRAASRVPGYEDADAWPYHRPLAAAEVISLTRLVRS